MLDPYETLRSHLLNDVSCDCRGDRGLCRLHEAAFVLRERAEAAEARVRELEGRRNLAYSALETLDPYYAVNAALEYLDEQKPFPPKQTQ